MTSLAFQPQGSNQNKIVVELACITPCANWLLEHEVEVCAENAPIPHAERARTTRETNVTMVVIHCFSFLDRCGLRKNKMINARPVMILTRAAIVCQRGLVSTCCISIAFLRFFQACSVKIFVKMHFSRKSSCMQERYR